MRILGYLALRYRKWLCKYFPKVALKVYSKHKGECNNCGDCCRTKEWNCEYLKDNKCTNYKDRPLSCKVGPFPFDLWFNEKYKNCSIYYFQKPKPHKK